VEPLPDLPSNITGTTTKPSLANAKRSANQNPTMVDIKGTVSRLAPPVCAWAIFSTSYFGWGDWCPIFSSNRLAARYAFCNGNFNKWKTTLVPIVDEAIQLDANEKTDFCICGLEEKFGDPGGTTISNSLNLGNNAIEQQRHQSYSLKTLRS